MEATEKSEAKQLQEALLLAVGWNDPRSFLQVGPWAMTDHDGQRWTVASDGRRMVWVAGVHAARELEAGVAVAGTDEAARFLGQARRDYLDEGLHRRYTVDVDALRAFCDVPPRYHCTHDAHQLENGVRVKLLPCPECNGRGEINANGSTPALFADASVILDRRLIAGMIHSLTGDFDMLAAGPTDPIQFRGDGWRFAVMPRSHLETGEDAPLFHGERP